MRLPRPSRTSSYRKVVPKEMKPMVPDPRDEYTRKLRQMAMAEPPGEEKAKLWKLHDTMAQKELPLRKKRAVQLKLW